MFTLMHVVHQVQFYTLSMFILQMPVVPHLRRHCYRVAIVVASLTYLLWYVE